jgi:pyrimidine operon attenuation protein/uracil phosphoribosyltransferase
MKRSSKSRAGSPPVLDAAGLEQKVTALEEAIWKEFGNSSDKLALVGIQTRGAHLARRLSERLSKRAKQEIPVGILDITLYRDDLHAIADQPEVRETEIPFDLEGRPIVLVDDVLFTGRTVRSAMNAMIDYARPKLIRLAVLVDRGLREVPINADYVGLSLKTAAKDIVDVNLTEVDGEDSVTLRRPGDAR